MLQIAALPRRRLDVAQAAADQRHACARHRARRARRSRPARRCWRSRSRRRARSGRGSAPRACARTSASEPEWPSTMALVLSHTIASTPSSPSAANAASSVGGPTSGCGSSFQSPVCSTVPCGRADGERLRLGDRVRHAAGIAARTAAVERAAGRDGVDASPRSASRPRPACGAAPRRRTGWRRPGSAAGATDGRRRRDGPHAHG